MAQKKSSSTRSGSGSTARSGSQSKSKPKTQSSSRSSAKKTAGKKTASRSSPRSNNGAAKRGDDAFSVLSQDHKKVQKMFKQAEKLGSEDSEELQQLVQTACAELRLHAELEEEIFYPAVREALDEQDLIAEAQVEHDSAKELMAQLENMNPQDERYKATFKVLGEYVNHHIKEEEGEIFRAAKRAKVNVKELGEQILQRKEQVQPSTEPAQMFEAGEAGSSRSSEDAGNR